MPKPRLSWFKAWVGLTRHEKVAPLDDKTFRAWVELLDAGAQQTIRGQFVNAEAAAAVVRQPLPIIMKLITAGLLDQHADGSVTLHDWKDWQRWQSQESHVNHTGLTPESLTNDSRARVKSKKESKSKEEEHIVPVELSEARARRSPPVDEPFIVRMVTEYADLLGGEDAVRDAIAAALNHKAVDKAKNKQLYVQRWLQRNVSYRVGAPHPGIASRGVSHV